MSFNPQPNYIRASSPQNMNTSGNSSYRPPNSPPPLNNHTPGQAYGLTPQQNYNPIQPQQNNQQGNFPQSNSFSQGPTSPQAGSFSQSSQGGGGGYNGMGSPNSPVNFPQSGSLSMNQPIRQYSTSPIPNNSQQGSISMNQNPQRTSVQQGGNNISSSSFSSESSSSFSINTASTPIPSTSVLTTPQQNREAVDSLINQLNDSLFTKKKEALDDFESFYVKNRVMLGNDEVRKLFVGVGSKLGLVENCGAMHGCKHEVIKNN